jgi:transposase
VEFKAKAVSACRQPGISIASVAMANGVNANLLRRWVIEAEQGSVDVSSSLQALPNAPTDRAATFVPLQLPSAPEPTGIHVELRRGGTVVTIAWPTSAAAECAAWMRELLR